ncbi:MAG: 5-oxoprolinase subunit PxpA [Flavobacteriaceae bacterium]|nr:5-oxoprolinase subunit PxpA [Flavobacteriaceae bacterium]
MSQVNNIDINADLGEGGRFDKQLMPLISSCSIACGGHFGDGDSMRATVRLANMHGVKVGAHPSFPDRNHFGREEMSMTQSSLTDSIFEQLLAFYAVCKTEDTTVNHIKLHGALYNYAAKDAATADAIVEAIIATKQRPKLYVQHGSILHKKAKNLIPLVFEAFIDRSYNSDLSLVPRNHPKALIEDPKMAWEQLFGMLNGGVVHTVNSEVKQIVATTFCIHGDHKHSVSILQYIHEKLKQHSISIYE